MSFSPQFSPSFSPSLSPNLVPNSAPNTIFNKEVSFSTLDTITGNEILEGYIVSNPSHAGITVVGLAGGNKAVVPLSTATGNGSPYLKFHFPSGPSANTMYITFCVKNTTMVDGFYDYKTGIPSSYRTSLRSWIRGTGNLLFIGTKTKSLKFTSYGSGTNKPQEAVTFYTNFQALFSTISSTPTNNFTL